MHKPGLNLETLKFAGGALIVLAAAAIMFPGFVAVAFALGRIGLIIFVAGGSCLALAHLTRRFAKMKSQRQAAVAQHAAPPDSTTS